MKVKNVLALAAANLGREDLVARINDCAAEPEGEVAALLRCYNLVENEIALDYFPLKREERFRAPHGTVPYARFRFAPVAILKAAGEDGRPISFEPRPAHLHVAGLRERERVIVTYTYSPAEKCFCAESEFAGRISARLLSYGIACEFCLTNGQYAEAAMWEKKYREALRAANICRRKLSVRARRWV